MESKKKYVFSWEYQLLTLMEGLKIALAEDLHRMHIDTRILNV